ncbi:hypothetical protein T484DRAFT_3177034 [Baffinella frigidus]|nr:hypothetical protein T484DRAFT_3177034 [Cryptophyta sp. CCMP2293]
MYVTASPVLYPPDRQPPSRTARRCTRACLSPPRRRDTPKAPGRSPQSRSRPQQVTSPNSHTLNPQPSTLHPHTREVTVRDGTGYGNADGYGRLRSHEMGDTYPPPRSHEGEGYGALRSSEGYGGHRTHEGGGYGEHRTHEGGSYGAPRSREAVHASLLSNVSSLSREASRASSASPPYQALHPTPWTLDPQP